MVEIMSDSGKVKRFRSCFICLVEMHDNFIGLEDSGHNAFVIDRSNKEAVASFMFWFKNVYLKGIPQVLTIIDFDIVQKNEDEYINLVNKIVANPEGNPLLNKQAKEDQQDGK